MKDTDITKIRRILTELRRCEQQHIIFNLGHKTITLVQIEEALALLPCPTCNGSRRMPESKVINGKLTSQNCLHRPECDINTVNHECKCTCDGPKPMPCPDCQKKPIDK